jgi:threonine/homoserine/homoserine lactone efflux protein
VVSPGPNFVLVSRTALAVSKQAGIGATLGIATGAATYACMAMFGLSVVIHQLPRLQDASRVAGGVFLMYIAYRIATDHASEDAAQQLLPSKKSLRYGYRLGLLTSLSNLKSIAFFVSVFASFDLLQSSLLTRVAIIGVCTGIEVVWYSLVTLLFSRGSLQNLYQRRQRVLDLILCCLLAALGLFSVYEGAQGFRAPQQNELVTLSAPTTSKPCYYASCPTKGDGADDCV